MDPSYGCRARCLPATILGTHHAGSIVAVCLMLFVVGCSEPRKPGVETPNAAEPSRTAPETALPAAGPHAGNVKEASSGTSPTQKVVSRQPPGGSNAARDGSVDLAVSKAPEPALVPTVTGVAQREAETILAKAGLKVGTVTLARNDAVPVGNVITHEPGGGASAPEGSAVNLVVCEGPETTAVPLLEGLSQEEAQDALDKAELKLGTLTPAYSDTVPEGRVITQDRAANARAARGSTVQLDVSEGPKSVAVPAVTGLSLQEAQAALEGAKLFVGAVASIPSDLFPEGYVVGQVPDGGANALPGSPVDLAVSAGPGASSPPARRPARREMAILRFSMRPELC